VEVTLVGQLWGAEEWGPGPPFLEICVVAEAPGSNCWKLARQSTWALSPCYWPDRPAPAFTARTNHRHHHLGGQGSDGLFPRSHSPGGVFSPHTFTFKKRCSVPRFPPILPRHFPGETPLFYLH
jgi:hypothetical protein